MQFLRNCAFHVMHLEAISPLLHCINYRLVSYWLGRLHAHLSNSTVLVQLFPVDHARLRANSVRIYGSAMLAGLLLVIIRGERHTPILKGE